MAKYQRLEFTDPDRQTAYSCQVKTGMLWKLGRDRKQFALRKFVLSRLDNKLYYYINEENGKVSTYNMLIFCFFSVRCSSYDKKLIIQIK